MRIGGGVNKPRRRAGTGRPAPGEEMGAAYATTGGAAMAAKAASDRVEHHLSAPPPLGWSIWRQGQLPSGIWAGGASLAPPAPLVTAAERGGFTRRGWAGGRPLHAAATAGGCTVSSPKWFPPHPSRRGPNGGAPRAGTHVAGIGWLWSEKRGGDWWLDPAAPATAASWQTQQRPARRLSRQPVAGAGCLPLARIGEPIVGVRLARALCAH